MVRRLLSVFVAGVACVAAAGCSVEDRSIGTTDLDRRLALIEAERMASPPISSNDTYESHAAQPAGNSFALVGSRQSPVADSRNSRGEVLSLGDFGPASDQPAAAGDEKTSTIDREAVYARRPPLPGFGQTVKQDVKNMPNDLWRDTKRVYGNPVNLVILGVAYGGALAVQEGGPDDTVEDHYNNHHTFRHDWPDTFATMGNPGTHFALAGLMYLVGQVSQDDKTYEVGKTLFSALIINGLSVMVGQTASWDRSPNGEWGTFPSGHTSSTFCVATVLNEAYGPAVGVPLYGLGVLVGISRLDDREHYLSDVLFGAVMGTVIGHSVATGRDPELFGWKVLPYADPAGGGAGVLFGKSFK